jgi:hypothetical protein
LVASRKSIELVDVRAKLYVPLPATSGVTSTELQAFAVTGPDEPVTTAEYDGGF